MKVWIALAELERLRKVEHSHAELLEFLRSYNVLTAIPGDMLEHRSAYDRPRRGGEGRQVTTLLHDIVIGPDGERTQLAMLAITGLERGHEWRVMVKENKARRSLWQNAYYHAVCVKIVAEFTGDTPSDVHEWFKKEFLPKVQRSFRGDEFNTKASTTEMNRGDFWDYYIEQIRAWAASELGVRIPDPDPHWKTRK